MSVAASAALRLVKFLDESEVHLFVASNDHLSYALTIVDDEIFLTEVDKQHPQFATIVSIDGSRRVQDGDTVFQRES